MWKDRSPCPCWRTETHLDQVLMRDLEKIVGETSVRTDEETLKVFRSSRGAVPEAVVRVGSTEDAAAVVRLANKRRTPFILADQMGPVARSEDSSGSSFALDFSMMNKVREMRFTDLFMTTEPGATLADLDFALRPAHFFFPPEPTAGRSSTIGRVVLVNPVHPGAEKYGSFRDYVLSVEAVTPSGEAVKLGAKTLKNSSGLQIERFLSGSGGLLGIPTWITLAVKPSPRSTLLFTAVFDSVSDGMSAARGIGSSPVVPSSLELLDIGWAELCGQPLESGQLALHVELSGHPEAVMSEADVVARICRATSASRVERTRDRRLIGERRSQRRFHQMFRVGEGTLFQSFTLPASAGDEMLRSIAEMCGDGGQVFGTLAFSVFGSLLFSVAARSTNHAGAEEGMSAIARRALSSGGYLTPPEWRTGPVWDRRCGMTIPGDRLSAGLKEALDPVSVLNAGGMSM